MAQRTGADTGALSGSIDTKYWNHGNSVVWNRHSTYLCFIQEREKYWNLLEQMTCSCAQGRGVQRRVGRVEHMKQ